MTLVCFCHREEKSAVHKDHENCVPCCPFEIIVFLVDPHEQSYAQTFLSRLKCADTGAPCAGGSTRAKQTSHSYLIEGLPCSHLDRLWSIMIDILMCGDLVKVLQRCSEFLNRDGSEICPPYEYR